MTTLELLQKAKQASRSLAMAGTDTKNRALLAMADSLVAAVSEILAANQADLDAARGTVPDVMLDRLALTRQRIADMAEGIRQVAALPDPVGRVLRSHTLDNGLLVEKIAVSMGVVAIIYESRPNVTSDAAALAVKSGSACVLRGGKEAFRSNQAVVEALRRGLQDQGLDPDWVSLVQDTSRDSARQLMTASGLVDLLIPRGGAGLIRSCVENATVPCIQTGTGICHIYVDAAADQEKALNILENAKTSRPSVCNAAEVCLVHKDIAAEFLPRLRHRLVDQREEKGVAPVQLRLDERAAAIIPGQPAGCGPRPSSRASRREKRTSTPSFWIISWRWPWWTAYSRRWSTSPGIPPATARPSSPPTRKPQPISPQRWIRRRCMSTPPPASPTAGSSGWVARWAFPPRSSTPGAPWGWRS